VRRGNAVRANPTAVETGPIWKDAIANGFNICLALELCITLTGNGRGNERETQERVLLEERTCIIGPSAKQQSEMAGRQSRPYVTIRWTLVVGCPVDGHCSSVYPSVTWKSSDCHRHDASRRSVFACASDERWFQRSGSPRTARGAQASKRLGPGAFSRASPDQVGRGCGYLQDKERGVVWPTLNACHGARKSPYLQTFLSWTGGVR